MKIVLTQDVPGLGKAHEIKSVSDGYARNYLIPRGLAVAATPGQIKAARKEAEVQQSKDARLRERARAIVERLRTSPLRFQAKAGEKGRLYGSITNADIAKAISKTVNAPFDKRWVLLERPIREVGTHVVELKLRGGVRGQVQVIVTAEES